MYIYATLIPSIYSSSLINTCYFKQATNWLQISVKNNANGINGDMCHESINYVSVSVNLKLKIFLHKINDQAIHAQCIYCQV